MLEGLGEKLKLTVVSASGLPSGYGSTYIAQLHLKAYVIYCAHHSLWPLLEYVIFFVRRRLACVVEFFV